MIRKNFYLTQEQEDALASVNNLSVSENIRRAIDEYIEKHKKTTTSPSKKGAN